MLHTTAVSPDTLALIKDIQKEPALSGFLLVGGTSLSLQIGHRRSIDIDLFTRGHFDAQSLMELLEKKYGFALHFQHQNTLKGFIQGIFIDILRHDYPWIEEPVAEEGILMASKPDIGAMKLNAISSNGTRVKDFVDVYFLLRQYTFGDLVEFYKEKYKERNDFHVVKSMTYFEDLNPADWPDMILEQDLTLEKVKKRLTTLRDEYLKKLNF